MAFFLSKREYSTYQSDKYKKTVWYMMYMAHMKICEARSMSIPMIVSWNVEAYNNTNIDPDPVNLGKRAPCEDEQTDRKHHPSEASGVKPSFWTTLVIVSPETNELK